MLTFYLLDNDTLVDFSCGANAFVPLVKQEGRKQGLTILGCSFDIITSQNLEDFKRCSWMDVRPGLPPMLCCACVGSLLGDVFCVIYPVCLLQDYLCVCV